MAKTNITSIANKRSAEARKNISVGIRRSNHSKVMKSQEVRERISVTPSSAMKKKWQDPKYREKVLSGRKGHTVSEETRAKFSAAMKGKPKYEEHHGLIISNEAITTAVELASRYISDRFMPDKAIDLIDEAGSKVRIKNGTQPITLKRAVEKDNGGVTV